MEHEIRQLAARLDGEAVRLWARRYWPDVEQTWDVYQDYYRRECAKATLRSMARVA